MKPEKWNVLVFFTLLLTAWTVTPCRAEQPDKVKACQLYECQKKAAEYTYNLDKAGDKELFDQHLSNCIKLSPPEKCLPKPLKMSVGDPSTITLQPNPGAEPADLEIMDNKTYIVSSAGTYRYRFINIHSGGTLRFDDGQGRVDFWAKSILVENKGTLQIGAQDKPITDRIITLNLYGSDKDNLAITCKSSVKDVNQCGVPVDTWKNKNKTDLPGGANDYFYGYENLITDDSPVNLSGNSPAEAYFGRKVIAVSYGGTLLMFGKKGVDNSASESSSGKSWVRLDGSMKKDDTTLKLSSAVDWQPDDRIVVTSTNYLPGHAEQFTIKSLSDNLSIAIKENAKFPHNGQKFDLSKRNIPSTITSRQDVETRSAVALLSRNIRIVSGGVNAGDPLPDEKSQDTDRYFGGHLIVRQGFEKFQMQGVELYQMGQGGRMAHVPINFFLTRQVPKNTFVKDCSIWDSMNHWIELRGTQNVTLQRNVGYKSIGHGFVLADGTEADNNLLANIGIYARPGLDYPDNPRKVPGVLALRTLKDNNGASVLSHTLAYGGDAFHPSPFFVMNAYNTINFNMASGAGACGSCYWFAPAHIGLFSKNKKWEGMAGILDVAPGGSIIKSFSGNFCSTAMYSLITVADSEQCWGIGQNPAPHAGRDAFIPVIANPLSSKYIDTCSEDNIENCIVPNGDNGQQSDGAAPFIPPPAFTSSNVSLVKEKACTVSNSENCGVNVIDSYTSSFNFANKNFSAIWLRTFWFLFTDSFVSDVLSGGLTMVSGGSYDQVPTGYWGLTRKSVFVGSTQPANDFATPSGPRIDTTSTGLSCDGPGAYCLLKNKDNQYEGISFPTGSFGNYQRLVNIYDGPVYLDAVAFLDVKKTVLDTCTSPKKVSTAPPETMPAQQCDSTGLIYGKFRSFPIPVDKDDPNYKAFDKNNPDDFAKNSNKCILPNAAIGWKQPNGFYYPPAFHMRNLYFNNVDIRHYVVVPPFKSGQMQTDHTRLSTEYCAYDNAVFDDFTDIDRQTEINDDDGTLSGISLLPDPTYNAPKNLQFTGSISVNNDSFFYTPNKPFECLSQQTCLQVPYDQLNLAVIPTDYTPTDDQKKAWALDCSIKKCAGALIYRQYRLSDTVDPQGDMQGIRMMGHRPGNAASCWPTRGNTSLIRPSERILKIRILILTSRGGNHTSSSCCLPNRNLKYPSNSMLGKTSTRPAASAQSG